MCLVSLARFLAPSPRLLPSSTNLCEQLLSREQVQRNGEAPSAKSDMIPLPIMEIVDTPPPCLFARGCSGQSDLGINCCCLQLALRQEAATEPQRRKSWTLVDAGAGEFRSLQRSCAGRQWMGRS